MPRSRNRMSSREERRHERIRKRKDERATKLSRGEPLVHTVPLYSRSISELDSALERMMSGVVDVASDVAERIHEVYRAVGFSSKAAKIAMAYSGGGYLVPTEVVEGMAAYRRSPEPEDSPMRRDIDGWRVISKGRHPVVVLEGLPAHRREAAKVLTAEGWKYVALRADTVRTLEVYVEVLMRAVTTWSLEAPVVIDGGWLSDQLLWASQGDEESLPLVGRIMERLYERYAVGRVLICNWGTVDVPEDLQTSFALVRACMGTPSQAGDVPDTFKGHRTYLAYLLGAGMGTQGWRKASVAHDLLRACQLVLQDLWAAPDWCFEEATSWYGRPNPHVVFVGDAFNPLGMMWPFPFARVQASSSYLNAAINMAGYAENRTGYVNVNDEGGEAALRRWLLLPDERRPLFVTLGNLAAQGFNEVLSGTSVVPHHVGLDHPSYVRRFHHSKLHDYADTMASFVDFDPRSATHHVHAELEAMRDAAADDAVMFDETIDDVIAPRGKRFR
jgi:hypothetical protein